MTAAGTGTCFTSTAHFLPAFIPAGVICTGRTGCMVAGRTDATGLSTTGRTAWTAARITGRMPAGRCAAVPTEIGGKIPQRRNRRFIRLAVRGCGRADSPRFHIRRNTALSHGLRCSNCRCRSRSHRDFTLVSLGCTASRRTVLISPLNQSGTAPNPPMPRSSMSSAIMFDLLSIAMIFFTSVLGAQPIGYGMVASNEIQRPL